MTLTATYEHIIAEYEAVEYAKRRPNKDSVYPQIDYSYTAYKLKNISVYEIRVIDEQGFDLMGALERGRNQNFYETLCEGFSLPAIQDPWFSPPVFYKEKGLG